MRRCPNWSLSFETSDQPLSQRRAVVIHVQCEVNRSAEVTAGISEVVSSTAVNDDVHGMAFGDEKRDGIGQLQLTTGSGLDASQCVENGAIEQVSTCGSKRGRRIFHRRLLDHSDDLEDVGVGGVRHDLDVEDAVRADFVLGNVDGAQNRTAGAWRAPWP